MSKAKRGWVGAAIGAAVSVPFGISMVGDMVVPAAILGSLIGRSTGDSRAEVVFERPGAVTGRRSLPWPGVLAGIIAAGAMAAASGQGRAARITWDDVAPLAPRFEAWRLNASGFPSYIERIHQQNRQRVREGDLDHLVFYLLQSTRFTTLPAIEPAVSARTLVESLDPPQRSEFLNTAKLDAARVPAAVRSRIAAFERALDKPGEDARLRYFRELLAEAVPKGCGSEGGARPPSTCARCASSTRRSSSPSGRNIRLMPSPISIARAG